MDAAVSAAVAGLRSKIDLNIHFDGPLNVRSFDYPTYGVPSKATLSLKGTTDMPGTITVDYTAETATVDFTDDKGDATTAPAGAVATFASDNTAVATVANDATNPLQGDITPVAVGTCNISVSFNGTALEADGVTPIPDPASAPLTVTAGPAVAESLVLGPN